MLAGLGSPDTKGLSSFHAVLSQTLPSPGSRLVTRLKIILLHVSEYTPAYCQGYSRGCARLKVIPLT
jgi:hypothetical protein